jgi:predicted nucleic acid-binding protein
VTYYADTSWWLNFLFRNDRHHQASTGLFARDPAARVLWTPWQRVEIFNTLYQLKRKGDLELGDAKRATRQLTIEVRLGYWEHREFSWTDAVRRACQVSEQLGPILPIRAMDLFHVAVALTVRAPIFLSFDTDQIALARAAGFVTPELS